MVADMSDVAIRVQRLGKSYRIGAKAETPKGAWATLRQMIGAPFAYLSQSLREPTGAEMLHALKDISFEVRKGEVLGMIGRNGAGKSTLLKILARITEPSSGRAELYGRVASLLEVGTGFHPELTGRENILLSGAIQGMRRTELQNRFEEIVNFSGVERFLDTPVKRYSSGMYVRLAFSVAAHLESDILLMDEVLAVGDSEFQRKCIGKLENVAQSGRTVVFVSHSLNSIKRLCDRAILLDNGSLTASGDVDEVIEAYYSNTAIDAPVTSKQHRPPKGKAHYTTWRLDDGTSASSCRSGDTCTLHFEISCDEAIDDAVLGFLILTASGMEVLGGHSLHSLGLRHHLSPGSYDILWRVRLPLRPDSYQVTAGIVDHATGEVIDYWEPRTRLLILPNTHSTHAANNVGIVSEQVSLLVHAQSHSISQ